MDVEIPANTTATVFVPAASITDVTESGVSLDVAGIRGGEVKDRYIVVTLGSGQYHFAVKK
jgi:alpha-L-rhamnosidase